MERGGYSGDDRKRKLGSAAAAIAVQGGLMVAIVYGLAVSQDALPSPMEALDAINVTLPKPAPTPTASPSPSLSVEPEGAAAPPSRKASPKAIVAPTPKIPIKRDNPVDPAPTRGDGDASRSGATTRDGPGTGGGGEGTGTGSGRSGTGGGGAAVTSRPVYASGSIRNRDYPRSASRERAEGDVTVRFTVKADGRVTGCRITKSSGNADIDAVTCRLIEDRFRYTPARDVAGNAIDHPAGWEQRYWLEGRN